MLIALDNAVYAHTQEDAFACVADVSAAALVSDETGDAIVTTDARLICGEVTSDTGVEETIECAIRSGGGFLIGTEGPHIYRWSEGASDRVTGFDDLSCRDAFHTPWGGPASVRSFASSESGHVYADIHVGSIMHSTDDGTSWAPVTPDLHEDVHQVATTPAAAERVYANTARGVSISEDRGDSWTHRSEGFPYLYGRAIAVHPDDLDCLLATVSRGPHGNADGQLYRSDDGGESWEHVTDGFPDTVSHNIDTFQIDFSNDGRAWAAEERSLYVSEDRGRTWSEVWQAPSSIELIACY